MSLNRFALLFVVLLQLFSQILIAQVTNVPDVPVISGLDNTTIDHACVSNGGIYPGDSSMSGSLEQCRDQCLKLQTQTPNGCANFTVKFFPPALSLAPGVVDCFFNKPGSCTIGETSDVNNIASGYTQPYYVVYTPTTATTAVNNSAAWTPPAINGFTNSPADQACLNSSGTDISSDEGVMASDVAGCADMCLNYTPADPSWSKPCLYFTASFLKSAPAGQNVLCQLIYNSSKCKNIGVPTGKSAYNMAAYTLINTTQPPPQIPRQAYLPLVPDVSGDLIAPVGMLIKGNFKYTDPNDPNSTNISYQQNCLPVTYLAKNLPPDLKVDPNTGAIYGTLTKVIKGQATITIENKCTSGTAVFNYDITGSSCGNNNLDPGEECDLGPQNGQQAGCNADCTTDKANNWICSSSTDPADYANLITSDTNPDSLRSLYTQLASTKKPAGGVPPSDNRISAMTAKSQCSPIQTGWEAACEQFKKDWTKFKQHNINNSIESAFKSIGIVPECNSKSALWDIENPGVEYQVNCVPVLGSIN
ncbi:MAG: hypothetical protein KBD64_04965 [Gammaproteobacteria bacterium]|nr:hypothetical protein [Gammaproteobacteria bacterium]